MIAHRLAEQFQKAGYDPNKAYAYSDDEALSDFGGPEAFRGL